MNTKTNIDNNREEPKMFEGRFVIDESILLKLEEESCKELKKGEDYINVAQNEGVSEVSVQKNVSAAAEFDAKRVLQQEMGHDNLSCVTCNSYITKRFRSHGRVISSETQVAEFHVERVINEQEIHDMWCSSCNSYINKRLILHRRDIAPDEEAIIPPELGHEMIVAMPEVNTVKSPVPEEECRLEIIRAVVYGGLLQTISSLSVVVSAAGGDASTLNIVALALANVFGGLLVLGHNLSALKREQNTEHYGQQLGKPGNFLLHATIAIISYLVFGLMSPIIYGFSFYKSDNKYLKLATLAPVSLICITLLSIGKAYVQRPPKTYIQTVFSYISLGVMVAGPGYIAGDVANMLLKKFQVFDSLSIDSLAVIEAEVVKGAWSSY